MKIIDKTGNCVAASIPLGLAMAYEQKLIDDNKLIFLVGTGAGLSIASAVIRI